MGGKRVGAGPDLRLLPKFRADIFDRDEPPSGKFAQAGVDISGKPFIIARRMMMWIE